MQSTIKGIYILLYVYLITLFLEEIILDDDSVQVFYDDESWSIVKLNRDGQMDVQELVRVCHCNSLRLRYGSW